MAAYVCANAAIKMLLAIVAGMSNDRDGKNKHAEDAHDMAM